MGTFFNKQNQNDLRRNLRNNLTNAEKLLWYRLKSGQLGYKFRRQFGINEYIVDFYCPKLRLVVEVDGDVHGIDANIVKDRKRQNYLEEKGFTVKRYNDSDIIDNCESVVEDICVICNKLSKRPHLTSP